MKTLRVIAFLGVLLAVLLMLPATAEEKDKKPDPKEAAKELELKACGPKEKEVNFSADTDKKYHPTPAPTEGKAIIYVIRPTMLGNKVQTKLAVDGEWKGANRGNNYFFFEMEPGEHFFCSKAENRSALSLTVEAGKTYFLQQHVQMGFMKAGNRLESITEEKGREKLPKLNLAVWETKQ